MEDREQTEAQGLAAAIDAIYRLGLSFIALYAVFSEFPEHRFAIGATWLLLFGALRGAEASNGAHRAKAARGLWLEQLTVRIALVDFHNASLRGESIDYDEYYGAGIWDDARRRALADIKSYDDSKRAFGVGVWGTAILTFLFFVACDLGSVWLAATLAG